MDLETALFTAGVFPPVCVGAGPFVGLAVRWKETSLAIDFVTT